MSDFNIVVAHFGHHNRVVMTDTLYQYDYGQQLKIEGITALPQTFQAHFSNVQHGGVSITVTGINGMVDVPNSLLMTGKRIYCWIYVTETGSGETVYQILMPVQSRPMPEYYDVEDVGVFDSVVNQVAEYAATATTGATSATASATAAAGSEAAAAASASAAADSAENAAASEANAEASASAAQASDASAATAATTATGKAAEAAQSATSAGSAADRAEAAQGAAETAQEAAETAATSATADAATATTKATAAAASATTASTKATDATNAATTATAQAATAEAAKTTAVEAKTAAQSAQSAAETAATTATAKATEAAASATAAARAAASINTPDSALSDTSTNAVQNKVITGELTDVKSAISAEDTVVNLKHNLINYGYNVSGHRAPVSGATDTLVFGYDREGQVITLSGGPLNKNTVVKISGDVGTALSTGVYPAWLATVLLASDHKYALTVKKLTENAPNIMASVYKQGSSSSMGTDDGWTGDTYQRTIVGDGSLVRVCLYIPSGTAFNSDSYLVLMEDITEQPNEEFEYFDYKANEALNLVDYGYGSAKTALEENASAPGSGSAVGVERLGTFVKLNFAGSGTQKRVKVSGDIDRTSGSSSFRNWTGDIRLEEGEKYRFALKKLSGVSTSGGVDDTPGTVVYLPNGSTSIATIEKETGDEISATFIAPASLVTLALFINGSLVLEDALFDVTLEKINTNTYDIEDYYTDEMTDTIGKVRAEVTEPSLVFPWATDIHRYTASVQTFPEMIRNMKAFAKAVECDFVLDSGDTIEGNAAQDVSLGYAYDCIAAFREIGEPLLYSDGNHDNNPYTQSGARAFTLKQVFSGFYSATKGVSFNINENGTDYYFDFNELGVRFISLNSCNASVSITYAFGATTAAWLSDALNTDKQVVLTCHVSPVYEHVWNNNSPTNQAAIKQALDNFVGNGGKLIVLTGHSHVDAEFIDPYVEVTDVCQKFEKADITAVGYTRMSGYIDGIRNPDRTAGTYTADAWSVVVYKPISKDLSIIRFGAGVDRYIHCNAIAPTTLTTKLSGAVTWSSSDTTVATVADGVVTGVASGKCAVIAKDAEGNIEVWTVEVS